MLGRVLGVCVLVLIPFGAAQPQQQNKEPTLLKQEPAPGTLANGARAYVDDGTCPSGQVKQLIGGSRTTKRESACVSFETMRAKGTAAESILVGSWEGLAREGTKLTLVVRAASPSAINGEISNQSDRARRLRSIEMRGLQYNIAVGDTSRLELTLVNGKLVGRWCTPGCANIELSRQ